MAMDQESDWTKAFADLKPDKTPAWAAAMADAVDARVTGKVELSGLIGKPTFTFNKAVFAAQLMALKPVPDAVAGMTGFANAWATAMTASTMVVTPGSALGAPSPATLWSVIFTSLIDASSVQLAKTLLISTLPTIPLVKDATQSKFGATFRKAFLMCSASVTGLNTLPPPPAGPGPLPLPGITLPFI